jgi:hypothetical protein
MGEVCTPYSIVSSVLSLLRMMEVAIIASHLYLCYGVYMLEIA